MRCVVGEAVSVCGGERYGVVAERVGGEFLEVVVEREGDGGRWAGRFSGAYVEQVTKQTGSRQSLDTFCSLLRGGLTGEKGDGVYVDLLTGAELEAMRGGSAGAAGAGGRRSHGDKRFLVLTWQSDVDRVHYPLPLARAAASPAAAAGGGADAAREAFDAAAAGRRDSTAAGVADNVGAYVARIAQLEAAVDFERRAAMAVQRERDALAARLHEQQDTLRANRALRDRCARMEEEMRTMSAQHGRATGEKKREVEVLCREVSKVRGELAAAKRQVRDLERQLTGLAAERRRAASPAAHPPRTAPVGGQFAAGLRERPVGRSRSPAHSGRGMHPPAEPHERGRSRDRRPPRSASAPGSRDASPGRPFQRFDPTAYVREREAKLGGALVGRSRSASAERRGREEPRAALGRKAARPSSFRGPRDESPGRILDEVSARLSRVLREGPGANASANADANVIGGAGSKAKSLGTRSYFSAGDQRPASAREEGRENLPEPYVNPPGSARSEGGQPLDGAAETAADIDRRLSALQDFLRDAKAGDTRAVASAHTDPA